MSFDNAPSLRIAREVRLFSAASRVATPSPFRCSGFGQRLRFSTMRRVRPDHGRSNDGTARRLKMRIASKVAQFSGLFR